MLIFEYVDKNNIDKLFNEVISETINVYGKTIDKLSDRDLSMLMYEKMSEILLNEAIESGNQALYEFVYSILEADYRHNGDCLIEYIDQKYLNESSFNEETPYNVRPEEKFGKKSDSTYYKRPKVNPKYDVSTARAMKMSSEGQIGRYEKLSESVIKENKNSKVPYLFGGLAATAAAYKPLKKSTKKLADEYLRRLKEKDSYRIPKFIDDMSDKIFSHAKKINIPFSESSDILENRNRIPNNYGLKSAREDILKKEDIIKALKPKNKYSKFAVGAGVGGGALAGLNFGINKYADKLRYEGLGGKIRKIGDEFSGGVNKIREYLGIPHGD
jgi:hypothetical protein